MSSPKTLIAFPIAYETKAVGEEKKEVSSHRGPQTNVPAGNKTAFACNAYVVDG